MLYNTFKSIIIQESEMTKQYYFHNCINIHINEYIEHIKE